MKNKVVYVFILFILAFVVAMILIPSFVGPTIETHPIYFSDNNLNYIIQKDQSGLYYQMFHPYSREMQIAFSGYPALSINARNYQVYLIGNKLNDNREILLIDPLRQKTVLYPIEEEIEPKYKSRYLNKKLHWFFKYLFIPANDGLLAVSPNGIAFNLKNSTISKVDVPCSSVYPYLFDDDPFNKLNASLFIWNKCNFQYVNDLDYILSTGDNCYCLAGKERCPLEDELQHLLTKEK